MSEQRAPQHTTMVYEEALGVWTCIICETSADTEEELHRHICPGTASLPESQPSPSGDAREWCLRNKGHQFVEEYCSAEIYDCMTEFAKVSGQAEKRLHRINELLELLRNCGMQGRAQSYVQEIRELVAALQEKPQ